MEEDGVGRPPLSHARRALAATLLAAALLASGLVALVVTGCSRRESRSPAADSTRAVVRDTLSSYANPADAPEPRPADPTGPQIGRGDSLINAHRAALEEWAAMWRAAIPGFRLDSLWRTGRESWRPILVSDPVGVAPDEDLASPPWEDAATAAAFTVTSPNGRFDLEIDTYQAIVEYGDELEIGGEPDTRAAIFDRQTRTESVLFVWGTMTGSHWGRWFDESSFALAGWSASDFGQWKNGWLHLYSLRDSSCTVYVAPTVAESVYVRYEARWHTWIEQRYRAAKRRAKPA